MFSLFLLLLCKLSTAQTRHLIRWCPRSVGPDASASTHGLSAQNRNWSYHRLSGISEEKRGYVSLVISFCFSSPTLHWREILFFSNYLFLLFQDNSASIRDVRAHARVERQQHNKNQPGHNKWNRIMEGCSKNENCLQVSGPE